MTENCSTCRYWKPEVAADDYGHCRRYAPRGNGANFALTRKDVWCGDYEVKSDDKRP